MTINRLQNNIWTHCEPLKTLKIMTGAREILTSWTTQKIKLFILSAFTCTRVTNCVSNQLTQFQSQWENMFISTRRDISPLRWNSEWIIGTWNRGKTIQQKMGLGCLKTIWNLTAKISDWSVNSGRKVRLSIKLIFQMTTNLRLLLVLAKPGSGD